MSKNFKWFYFGLACVSFTSLFAIYVLSSELFGVYTLTNVPALAGKLNTQYLSKSKIQNLMQKVGISTYGGQLIVDEIIGQHYQIPKYEVHELIQQAQYINQLQKLRLINGTPMGMYGLDIPSIHSIQKVENMTSAHFLDMDKERRSNYIQSVKYFNKILGPNSYETIGFVRLTVQQVKYLSVLLHTSTLPESYIQSMITRYIGTGSIHKLYEKDIKILAERDECNADFGKGNAECAVEYKLKYLKE